MGKIRRSIKYWQYYPDSDEDASDTFGDELTDDNNSESSDEEDHRGSDYEEILIPGSQRKGSVKRRKSSLDAKLIFKFKKLHEVPRSSKIKKLLIIRIYAINSLISSRNLFLVHFLGNVSSSE